MRRSSILLLVLSLSACSHGFNRENLKKELGNPAAYQTEVKEEDGPVTAEQIQAARGLKPQLWFPFSLAVYDSGGCGWTSGFKEDFQKSAELLKKRGIVSQMFMMSSLVATQNDLAAVRLAAAKHGADAVLYLRCVEQEDKYLNSFSLLYLTILGYWAAPGTSIDVLLMLQGAMWDVGNEYLYLTVESEAEGSVWGPGATVDAKNARERAKKKALESFSEELVERMTALK